MPSKKTTSPKKGGRPLIPINWDAVKALCQIQCTGEEIAAVLGVSYDTLERRCKTDNTCSFAEYIKRESQGGKASLRRKLWKLADKSGGVAIFLAKNILGMKDIPDLTDEDRPDVVIVP
jgi:hypothetical protein